MDEAHKKSDAYLKQAERRVQQEYAQAATEVQAKLEDYLQRYEVKNRIKLELLKKGEITKAEYDYWRTGQIMIGKRWEEMRDTLAQDLSHTNEIAASIINGYTPEVYALNHNYGTYEAERGAMVDTSYTLYDRQTVERLMRSSAAPIPQAKVDIPKDLKWNQRQVTSAVTQSILQGESIRKAAKRIAEVTSESNMHVAIRNARTMITSAENAGRVDSYKRAAGMGIRMKQVWLATLDGRTRHSHRQMDGEKIKVGGKFSNGCRYPGDPYGPAWEVYNCRCTLIGEVQGVDFNASDISNRNNYKLGSMSYDEWKNEHTKTATSAPTAAPISDNRSKLVKSIMESSTTSQMNEDQKKEFEAILGSMSEEHLYVYDRMTSLHGGNDYHRRNGGWYSPGKQKVEMDINADSWEKRMGRTSAGAWKTKFHEELHQLDHALSISHGYGQYGHYTDMYNPAGKKLIKAMREDIIDFMNQCIDVRNARTGAGVKPISDLSKAISSEAKSAFFEGLKNMGDGSFKYKASISAFTDAVGLITKSRINPYVNGYWGHDTAYQKNRGENGALSECFAEIGSHIMRNDQESLDALRPFMPRTIDEYKSTLSEIAEWIRNNELKYTI